MENHRPNRYPLSSHPLYAFLGPMKFPLGREKMLEAICRHAVEKEGMKQFSQFSQALRSARAIRSMEEKRRAEKAAMALLAEQFRSLTKSGKARLRRSINRDIMDMDIYEVQKKSAKRKFTMLFDHTVSNF